ncbi:Methyltransf_5 domain-containing protein [Cephalotus follicularis]|uniref:Methyltransf_5 domain-containing protein n=1 Tax=Cephalotus follicularis TaxID=3775 RepID=A0A1Q3B782_CEPFO|nr:Methyltransf_5 domain-containing protein [Cephalotus follicularis]
MAISNSIMRGADKMVLASLSMSWLPIPLVRGRGRSVSIIYSQNYTSNSNSITATDADYKKAKTKTRTRSNKEYDYEQVGVGDDSHVPVMLGEVLDVFSSSQRSICSFVDCTLGAAGHSAAIIRAHPELQLYIGMDVDPVAHDKARSRLHSLLQQPHLHSHLILSNYRHIKSVLGDLRHPLSGVDGILMDLGMSSMQVNNPERGFSVLCNGPLDMRMDPQATLKAEDILNLWPDAEVGRILREYGEESNWYLLQNKIIQARLCGGLHSTGELVDLIRNTTSRSKGGRQGWIKTATRVFQALRIAVNDELKTLEDSLYACFDCLAPGGRLAVISFHSLEDRIVKRTFLNIIESHSLDGDGGDKEGRRMEMRNIRNGSDAEETWIRQMIQGCNGTILTKRPMTPSLEEERLNCRCRSAKLRVIQKV